MQIKSLATKLTLEPKTLNIKRGGEYALEPPTLTPIGCTDAWTWTSSNKKVATVSAEGRITAVGRGTATITCRAQSGKYATCTITVCEEPMTVQLTTAKQRVTIGTPLKLTTKQNPSNAAASSSSGVASASADGVITAKKAGTAKITIRTGSGKTAICTVTVVKP